MRGSPLLAHCRVGTQLPDMETSEEPGANELGILVLARASNRQVGTAVLSGPTVVEIRRIEIYSAADTSRRRGREVGTRQGCQ